MKNRIILLKTASLGAALLLSLSTVAGCSTNTGAENKSAAADTGRQLETRSQESGDPQTSDSQTEASSLVQSAQLTQQAAPVATETQATEVPSVGELGAVVNDTYVFQGKSYKIITVDGGDMSGVRQSNVAVDIGFGDRAYWGMTNEYGQLVAVVAENITLQDDSSEPVGSNGRYYKDEADVPGTELSNYDKGHVIADSLGGVSNAYNITPQESTLNRHGDQAYMEKVIRDAGGCQNFIAMITYPDTSTQTPSSYKFQYTVKGNAVTDEFPNQNPEGSIASSTSSSDSSAGDAASSAGAASLASAGNSSATAGTGLTDEQKAELAKIDANGNGQVTIAEAKKAGISMPVTSDNWLYQFMDDRDGDGSVGE